MAAELHGEAPEDIEDLVLAWLLPLTGDPVDPLALGTERPDNGPLPFRMVTGLDIIGDANLFYVDALVSVHTFATGANPRLARTAAKREAKLTQRRMDVLARNPLADIEMADGRIVNVESLDTLERSHYEAYGVDNVKRYVARYNVGLSFVAIA